MDNSVDAISGIEIDQRVTAAMVKRIGLFAGPVLGLLCYYLLPAAYSTGAGDLVEFTHAGRATLALMVWMAGWWLTEAVDIEATALLPIVAFPLLGIAPLSKVLPPYAADVIFLFMGGFIIGLAIERWGLDRRIAFFILRLVGARPASIVGGFMAVTAFLSMWVSNTACAAMMVPIALSVIDLVLRRRTGAGLKESGGIPQDRVGERNFATGLLLSIAYAASVGGVATIIGSPPNGIAVRYIEQTFGRDVTFFDWLLVGLPFTLIFLPLAWLLVTRVLFRADIGEIEGGRQLFEEQYRKLGPLARGEKIVLAVFSVTAFLWIASPLLTEIAVAGVKPLAGLSDAGIAMLAALALFLIPADAAKGIRAMDWDTAAKLPWGVLILFGGGLTLAASIEANGVSAFIGNSSRALAGLPPLMLLLAITAMTVFLSELTSNTAQVATMVPVLAAMAPMLGMNPYVLILACTLGASSAYMMPVGTPPNAIVFGTGLVRLPQMMKAGFWLNLAGILVITALSALLITPLLGNVHRQTSRANEGDAARSSYAAAADARR
ncbi:MAG TPA: SLC13 family permease [Candidatus Binatia bacterium]|jgi:sodium-dependent dicarboxylate transporter 2/3/5